MEKINGNDNKQLIEAAKERLRWYTLEASEEEYDGEEVEALVQLLKCMEPVETEEVQTDDNALERFHAYVQMREQEDKVTLTDLSVKQKKCSGLTVFVRTHKYIAAAAAILLVIMIAGGSYGAVNAGKGSGFFYWLHKDSEGMTMITSPENMDEGTNIESAVEYACVEDVPEEYRKYLVDLEDIEQLEEYELKEIWVTKAKEYVGVKRCFSNESKSEKIYIGVFVYPEKTSLYRETYLSTELDSQIGDVQIMIKEKTEGDNEYTVYFYMDNVKYYVEGNINIDILKTIATEYENIVF